MQTDHTESARLDFLEAQRLSEVLRQATGAQKRLDVLKKRLCIELCEEGYKSGNPLHDILIAHGELDPETERLCQMYIEHLKSVAGSIVMHVHSAITKNNFSVSPRDAVETVSFWRAIEPGAINNTSGYVGQHPWGISTGLLLRQNLLVLEVKNSTWRNAKISGAITNWIAIEPSTLTPKQAADLASLTKGLYGLEETDKVVQWSHLLTTKEMIAAWVANHKHGKTVQQLYNQACTIIAEAEAQVV